MEQVLIVIIVIIISHHDQHHRYLLHTGHLYIYIYIPERNHFYREYSIAAVLFLLFMVPISLVHAMALLCFYVSIFRSMCAVPNMAVFCSSLTSWFPGMSLAYFLNNFEIVPVAPIITGIIIIFLLLSSSLSPLCRVFIHIFLKQCA
jgi:hypothetical protein